MTVAELHLGVLTASDNESRAARLETLLFAERSFDPIPVSTVVARRFAELVAALRAEERRAPVIDTLIAATAIAHELDLYTQDEGFSIFPGLTCIVIASVERS
jgi:predicted nucleic acid-binding protein